MATSHRPPEFLQPWLLSIEQAVVAAYRQYPQLRDKDVEDAYERLREFYQQLARSDEELDEPFFTHPARQALLEAIFAAIDQREELAADESLILNEAVQPGGYPIPNLETLYATGLNYLRRSARFWRKEDGPTGYLKFITEHVPGGGA